MGEGRGIFGGDLRELKMIENAGKEKLLLEGPRESLLRERPSKTDCMKTTSFGPVP